MKRIGLWIHNSASAIGHLHEIQSYGFDYICIKIADGAQGYHPADAKQLSKDAENIEFPIMSWSYIYPWVDPYNQVSAIKENLPHGCIDIILDAEGEWENNQGATHAISLIAEIKKQIPNAQLWLSSFYCPSLHAQFPWKEFMAVCVGFMPQAYQEGSTPEDTIKGRMKYSPFFEGKKIIPTVNTPRMLDILQSNFNELNVWLWDGTGIENSQMKNPGEDEGVRGLHGLWKSEIAKIKGQNNDA